MKSCASHVNVNVIQKTSTIEDELNKQVGGVAGLADISEPVSLTALARHT